MTLTIEQTKAYTDNYFNHQTQMWYPEWYDDLGPESKVFGYFLPSWGIDFVLASYSPNTAGDWGAVEGPASFSWGGTWICAAAGTDNIDLVKDIMYTMTCDTETMKQMTLDTDDFSNNSAAMQELANNSDFVSNYLGGQNHIAQCVAAASAINMTNTSPYDQGCIDELREAMHGYYNGTYTYEEALGNFYAAVLEKYPNLKVPK